MTRSPQWGQTIVQIDLDSITGALGALADAAATGDPTAVDTAMAYLKQLVNVLVGSDGVTTWPAGVAPADGVNFAEVLRKLYDINSVAVESFTFWSAYEDLITITGAAQDLALPSVVVAGIPAGATITRVIAMLKYRIVENTNAAINKISTAGPVTPAVQVKETAGGAFTDAITIIDDMIQVAATSRDGGDVLVGNIDVSAEVDGNATYDFQLDDILADGANLLLRDVQVGLRVEWTVV